MAPVPRTEGSSAAAPALPRKNHRRQPIVSCLECRRMKWKCDKVFPCQHCRKRGIADLCPDGQLPPVKGQQALLLSAEAQQGRIAELEAQLAAQAVLLEQHRQAQHPPDACAHEPGRRTGGELGHGAGSQTTHAALSGEADGHGDGQMDDAGQLTLGDEPGSSRFFGGAGAQFLLRPTESVRLTPDAHAFPSFGLNGTPAGFSDSFPFPGAPAGISLGHLQLHLPSRATAVYWARIYFENASFLNCMLDPPTFEALLALAYEPAAVSATLNNHDLALVFILLANGAAMDFALAPYNDVAERFYRLARACLAFDPSNSVPLVQTIHLMSRYVANSYKGPRTHDSFWTALGMATRAAQAIGLHRDGNRWGLEPAEIETRRRVFWEIQTEDVLQSMTQGRPRLISDATVDCTFPTVTQDNDPVQLFHHHKYRLIRVLGKINDLQTQTSTSPYNAYMDLHKALGQVRSDLPPVLSANPDDGPDTPRIVRWQRLAMRLLINEGHLFLHRVHFARALRDFAHEPLQSAYSFSYVSELEASRVMLVILREALELDQNFACRLWIFFFHAFTAFVNFAAVVIRSPRSSLATAALNQVEIGLAAFEAVPPGFRAREDLPTLRRLHAQAKDAISLSQDAQAVDSSAILGLGTTLVRVSAETHSAAHGPAAETNAFPESGAATGFLPTTIAEAVTHQHEGVATVERETILLDNLGGLGEDWSLPLGSAADALESVDFDFDAFFASIGIEQPQA
ncbi:hypothetical protein Q5752_007086 [Cryptotrichosporon argae]